MTANDPAKLGRTPAAGLCEPSEFIYEFSSLYAEPLVFREIPMAEWKFADPPNVAVCSDRSIFKSGDWIAYVVHEADDDDRYNDEGGSCIL